MRGMTSFDALRTEWLGRPAVPGTWNSKRQPSSGLAEENIVVSATIETVSPTNLSTGAFLNSVWVQTVTTAVGVAGWVRRASCGLSGHDMVRHFQPDHISLQ